MTQTALDEVVEWVQRSLKHNRFKTVDAAVQYWFTESVLTDPNPADRPPNYARYIAYCKEQDRQEKICVLRVDHHQGYREEWLSDGRLMVHKDHCKGEQIDVFDVECARAGQGWHYPPGTFKKEQDRKEEGHTPDLWRYIGGTYQT